MEASRAIAGLVLWAAAVPCLGAGCGPDLERTDGRLELEIRGVVADLDRVRIEVQRPEDGAEYTADQPRSGVEMLHVVESVPAGRADVRVLGLRGDVVGPSWRGVVTVPGNDTLRVDVDLTEGGAGRTATSNPIVVTIGPLSGADILGERLEGRVRVPPSALIAFLEAARALGPSPRASVVSVRLELDVDGSDDVDDLGEAWNEELEVTLDDGGAPVVVAEQLELGERTVVDPTLVAGADASALILAGDAGGLFLGLRGEAQRNATDQFAVRCSATLVLRAVVD